MGPPLSWLLHLSTGRSAPRFIPLADNVAAPAAIRAPRARDCQGRRSIRAHADGAREITDTLADLLISTVHRIGARAERKVAALAIVGGRGVLRPSMITGAAAAVMWCSP